MYLYQIRSRSGSSDSLFTSNLIIFSERNDFNDLGDWIGHSNILTAEYCKNIIINVHVVSLRGTIHMQIMRNVQPLIPHFHCIFQLVQPAEDLWVSVVCTDGCSVKRGELS